MSLTSHCFNLPFSVDRWCLASVNSLTYQLYLFYHLLMYFEAFDWMFNFSKLSNKHHWCICKNNNLFSISCTTLFPVCDFSSHSPHIFILSQIKGLTLYSGSLRFYSHSNFCTKLHIIKINFRTGLARSKIL